MSNTFIFDPDLYNISHHQNRIFVYAHKFESVYYKSPKTIRPPRVKVSFYVDHHLVPDDNPQPHFHYGDRATVSQRSFSQPLRALAFAGEAGPAFKAMLSRLEIPFDLRPSEANGTLIWGHGHHIEISHPPFGDDVAAQLSKAGEEILREAAAEADSRAVKEFRIFVVIVKRTIVEADFYQLLLDDDDDEFEPLFDDDDEFEAAVELLNTVTYGGGYLECAICSNDDFMSGTQVSGFPCSHWLHGGCIVTSVSF